MKIKKLNIENFGDIDSYSLFLEPSINVINGRRSEEIALALAGGLSYPGFEKEAFSASLKKGVNIDIRTDGPRGIEELAEASKRGVCPESRGCCLFLNDEMQRFDVRLQKYKRMGNYYERNEYSAITGGFGTNGVFREYLCDFIHSFRPIVLDEEKKLYITLDRSGVFRVERIDQPEAGTEEEIQPFLSIEEQTLFRYLIFLELVRFWDGVAELRSYDYIKMPLIICGLLERLDEGKRRSRQLLDAAVQTGHQVIVFSTVDGVTAT